MWNNARAVIATTSGIATAALAGESIIAITLEAHTLWMVQGEALRVVDLHRGQHGQQLR
jgi:hypothetical protein